MKNRRSLSLHSRSLLLAGTTALACVFVTQRAGAQECDGVEQVRGDAVTLELVSERLNRPVDVTAPPGDVDRLFVVEQEGFIRIIHLADDSLEPTPFLDIMSRVRCCGERGLLGLAFHPDYAENGRFFVYYTDRPDGDTVVSRFEVTDDPNVADPDSEVKLIEFDQPAGNHNGGQIAFSPLDGYLYIASGDGGSGCDRAGAGNNAQNPRSFLGKMLRIDVDSESDGKAYAIPADNPFVGEEGVLEEIWALGLRNPWRFAFDSLTGDMYIGDVGQNQWEEIDFQPGTSTGGENYEWRRLEGTRSSTVSNCSPVALTVGDAAGPILQYPHSGSFSGCSVTGGVVYRGCRMPDLHGTYFYADYCTNWIRTFRVEGGEVLDSCDRRAELNSGILPDRVDDISAFGTDARGEVYVCDLSTKLFRVVPHPDGDGAPTARIETVEDVELADPIVAVALDGSESDDGDGCTNALTFSWSQVSGPAVEVPTDSQATIELSISEIGEYVFQLEVDDGATTHTAETTVNVIEPIVEFRRGDTNNDARVDISDAVRHLLFLFGDGVPPNCFDANDANDSGIVDIADGVFILNYLFTLEGVVPPAPGPLECGGDPTPDEIDCAEYPVC